MHEDEILTDEPLARRLLAEQHPRWADLPLRLVDSFGTDHDVYRLGDDLSLRLPRTAWAARQAAKEAVWLPVIGPRLPLAVPEVVALGAPTAQYPHPWSVQTWLPGTDVVANVPRPEVAVRDLAAFVRALRAVEPRAGDAAALGRPGTLRDSDAEVRGLIARLGDRIAARSTLAAWEESVDAGPAPAATLTHSDLLPGNVLADGERLTGIIDRGGLAVADPALDLLPCWYLLPETMARDYADAVGADEAARLRGRGWALRKAVQALPYYWDTNPGMVRLATRALRRIGSDS